MRALLIVLSSSLFFTWRCVASESSFTIEIPAGKSQCFFQQINATLYKMIEIDYQVVDGGDLDIDIIVLSDKNVLFNEVRKKHGSQKFLINESSRDLEICFGNTFSYQARKVVFFEIYMLNEDGSLIEETGANDFGVPLKENEDLGIGIQKFQMVSVNIRNHLNQIEYHQALLRAYEARDRAIMTANFDRVTMWSVINTTALIIVAMLQVLLIRSMFDENSRLRRLFKK